MSLIINADDLGLDSSVNAAVMESFRSGCCSSATIMANMPGFQEACELAQENRLLDHIGVHFVMTEGTPLTDGIRECRLFCGRDGSFALTRGRRVLRLTRCEAEALAEELRAQVRECRRLGLPLTHADSHKNIHEEWGIARVVMRICREERIPYLRIARNCGRQGCLKGAYRSIVNLRFRRSGLARTAYFGRVADYEDLIRRRGLTERTRSAEVMVHPRLAPSGEVVDLATGEGLADTIGSLRGMAPFVSFADRAYQQ